MYCYLLNHADVTVSMQDTSLSRTEGDGSISVCAQVTSPMGGLGIPVAVTFTQSGRSPGISQTCHYCK